MSDKISKVHLQQPQEEAALPEAFDVFSMPEGTPLEQQRDFEIFWRKYTGRPCIVVSGVDYLTTLNYPKEQQ